MDGSIAALFDILVLVAGALVFVSVLAYFAILFVRVQSRQAPADWRISLLFYVGIFFLTLSILVPAAGRFYGQTLRPEVASGFLVLALLAFFYALYQRMEFTVAVAQLPESKQAQANRGHTRGKRR